MARRYNDKVITARQYNGKIRASIEQSIAKDKSLLAKSIVVTKG